MRKEKILPVSVFLSCCSLTAFASSHVTSADNFGKSVVVTVTKANTAKVLGIQQSSDDVKVTGTIADNVDDPVIGTTIRVRDSQHGTTTDLGGKFEIITRRGATLIISHIGMNTEEVKVSGDAPLNITLEAEAHQIEEVVVTVLGIKRSERVLSYNVQKVGSESLTTVKNPNFMNSLFGKVASANINASSAGMDGTARVVMRGPRSITRSNQTLYAIDGVPINNTSQGEISGGASSSQPGSESTADINPKGTESISVLSDLAAAALYGSAAAQGVIMITTKKGKEGKVSVTVSSSTQFVNPFIMPGFQNSYVDRAGKVKSWGAKTPSVYGNYEPKDFFNTGTSVQNNVALTAGTDKNQTYISVGTTNAKGIIPNNSYDRYNFAFRNTTTFLHDKMTFDFNFNYIKEHDKNLTAQGQYFNPLTAVYLFPRGESLDAIRTYELYDVTRGINAQNWNFGGALSMQNPCWVINHMARSNNRSRYMISASLKYKIFDWMDVVGRLRWDDAGTKQEDKRYALTINLFVHSKYGFYGHDKVNDRSLYDDLMFNINETLNDFSVSANLGGSFTRNKYNVTGFQGGLKAPSNLFTPNTIDYGSATADNRSISTDHAHKISSLFANVELGQRSMPFMIITGRNDWDSVLDGTGNVSFFYPPVGMSAVISQVATLPSWISYMKVHDSWASVGSATSPNITSPWRYRYNPASGTYSTVTYKFPSDFRPERTNPWEAGLTSRFFNNALTLGVTVYQSNTRNQAFLRPITGSQGFSSEYIQTGNVRNRDIELSLDYNRSRGDFTWSSSFAYSANRNKIVELLNDPNEVINQGDLNGANIILKEGGTMGDLYMTSDFKRGAEGNIAIKDGNVSQVNLTNPSYRGSVSPKGNIGFSNDFSWKGLNFDFVIIARLGGIVMSQTQASMDAYGVSKASADVYDKGGIAVNNSLVSAEKYYAVIGGENPIWSGYIYSATNVRIREAHLVYTFPRRVSGGMELILGLTANNLLMLYNKTPFDPEATVSTGIYCQGFDYPIQSSLRALGFNVKLKF